MTQQAIQLNVYRRNGRLLVVPGALCDFGFKDLDELIAADGSDLAQALERGERSARAVMELPSSERFDTGTPAWKQAGCKSYQDFVKGTILVSVVRNDQVTELSFMAPSPKNTGFDGDEDPVTLGPATPLNVVAERVLAFFAAHDR